MLLYYSIILFYSIAMQTGTRISFGINNKVILYLILSVLEVRCGLFSGLRMRSAEEVTLAFREDAAGGRHVRV